MAEIVMGLARHALTAIGVSVLGTSDFAVDDIATIAGAVVTIASVLWSVHNKRQNRKNVGGGE